MTYISPSTTRFYLSREALIQLDVISSNFPELGSAQQLHQLSISEGTGNCGCPDRNPPPPRPAKLPFECIPANNNKMREWLIDYYSTSTFNQCTHQPLPGMTGPKIYLHVDDNATPYAVHTPAPVPLHWQEAVKQLDDDVAMSVLEKVPIGEPSLWCHRMFITPKSDGSPRRTVDLSPLNAFCLRETHHVQPPFKHAEDRQYTIFITPWGRYRYRVAPQKEVDFAGFNISEHVVRPVQRYVDAVLKFPTPEKLTDVRSWFG